MEVVAFTCFFKASKPNGGSSEPGGEAPPAAPPAAPPVAEPAAAADSVQVWAKGQN